MLRSSFSPKRKARTFSYEPRYHTPNDERTLRERIAFESKVRRGQGRSVTLLAGLLFMVLYIIYKIGS
mgnify:CR=1 FL=1|jgi:hypothetical protein